jgi:hypothetical protein
MSFQIIPDSQNTYIRLFFLLKARIRASSSPLKHPPHCGYYPFLLIYQQDQTKESSMGSTSDPNETVSGCSSAFARSLPPNALKDPVFSGDIIRYHQSLLDSTEQAQELGEESLAPIMTSCMFAHNTTSDNSLIATQFGLLARLNRTLSHPIGLVQDDSRIFYNISPPSSTFICGSQGSGKSHTLSCMLENCLISSKAGRLPNPLTGVVFHYDTFISDTMGSPCEAAFLSSHPDVEVRVLCSPTNLHTMRVSRI